MILLRHDCLVFKTSDGDSFPLLNQGGRPLKSLGMRSVCSMRRSSSRLPKACCTILRPSSGKTTLRSANSLPRWNML